MKWKETLFLIVIFIFEMYNILLCMVAFTVLSKILVKIP